MTERCYLTIFISKKMLLKKKKVTKSTICFADTDFELSCFSDGQLQTLCSKTSSGRSASCGPQRTTNATDEEIYYKVEND